MGDDLPLAPHRDKLEDVPAFIPTGRYIGEDLSAECRALVKKKKS